MPVVRYLPVFCGLVLQLALMTGCDSPANSPAIGKGGASAGGSHAGGGATSTTGGKSNTGDDSGIVGPSEPPPPPPTTGVPQPSATVSAPNLKVLPWAGFKAAVTYTFDDTQPSQTEHWAELKATGVPATYFANPGQGWQSGYDAHWSAVAAAGNEIGNHTWNHCRSDLSGCTASLGSQADEISKTTDYIVAHFGVNAVYSFAAPFGDIGWNTYASPLFLLGRGVGSGMVPATGVSDWYNLPCFAVMAGQTATDFNTAIDNARTQGRWNIFLFHSLLPTSNNWYAGVEIAGVTSSMAYAQSLGDVWLDTFIEVGAYARAKQMFEALTPSSNKWTWTLPDNMPTGKILRVTVDGGRLSQGGKALTWDTHGYYEVALDAGSLDWSP